jgi:hypothetical protein
MIDVLFLSPPRRSDGSRYLFNNATLALASYLAQNGREVRVEPLVGPDWRDRLEKALANWKPRWAAISCKWWDTVYGATEVARYIRENHPEVRLVTGGQTATSFAEELIQKTAFDAVITGDAEVPLLQLVQGEPQCNVVLRDGAQTRRLPHTYVQPRTGGERLALLPNLGEIAPPELLFHAGYTAPFIWTGKGCQSACTFCSGSAFGHKKLFGRTGFQYRPLEHTLADMEALAPWTQNTVMFDFDPVADPGRESYYLELARQLPKGRYHAAFYAWSLPSKEFIQQVSENFASVLVSLDAQTYSEPLRKRLSARNQLKPFSSDLEILDTLDFIRRFDNVHGVVYGILGLQTETPYDVERAESLMSYIQDAYHDVLQPNGVHVTPLAMEPDSLMDRNPEKYGMRRLRHGFDDYLEFTRLRFHALHEEVFQAAYREDEPHPYGVHQAGDHPSRVYQDFSRIHAKITEKAHRWEGDKAVDSLRITPEEVRLDLKTRTIFHDDWRLVVWACSQARANGAARVVVDTTQAHVKVPPQACFPFDEQFAWAGAEWEQLKAARQRGELELQLVGGPTTHWGFLTEEPA